MDALILLALAALAWLAQVALGPDYAQQYPGVILGLQRTLLALLLLAAVRLLDRLLARVLRGGGRRQASSDLLRAVIAVALYLVAAMVYLRFVLGQDIASVLATSAMLSIIVGLALQPTLGHLFAGVSIELERPLRVGDYVRRDEIEGRVESLNWRSVVLRTERGSTVVLPNAEFTNRTAEVVAHERAYRHQVAFTVSSRHPPERVMAVAMQVLRGGIERVCDTPLPSVLITGNDPVTGTLRYAARFYTHAFLARAALSSIFLERLWYALGREGLELPPPPVVVLSIAEDTQASRGATDMPVALPPAAVARADAPLPGGRRALYAAGERCRVDGVAFIAAGSVIEGRELDAAEVAAEVRRLRALLHDAGVGSDARALDPRDAQQLLRHATDALGPAAPALCARVAALTEDPHLAWRVVADEMPDGAARKALLAAAPAAARARLYRGDWFGWAQALGLERRAAACEAGADCALQVWSPAQARDALRPLDHAALEAFAAALARHAPGCAGLDAAALRAWIAAA